MILEKIRYSVIVITLNEEKHISKCIESIQAASEGFSVEILISDGGSSDKTTKIASTKNLKVLFTDPGKGMQYRKGANAAHGEVLVFLTGDSVFPIDGFKKIENLLYQGKLKAATFRLAFDEKGILFTIYSWFTRFDSVFSTFGNQGIVVTRQLYDQVGGFPEWKIFEDVEFFRKIRKLTKIRSINTELVTSARRFKKNGLVRQQLRNFWYLFRFIFGTDHIKLDELYSRSRINARNCALVFFCDTPDDQHHNSLLTKNIGDEQAGRVYKITLENILKECSKIRCATRYIFIDGGVEIDNIKKWAGEKFIYHKQKGNSEAEKMSDAFQLLFELGYDKVLLVIPETPALNKKTIFNGFKAMKKNEFVIGPTVGGNFYLLGMRKFDNSIFEEVDWNTNNVLEKTTDKLSLMQKKYFLMEKQMELDSFENLKSLLEKFPELDLVLENNEIN